MNRAEFQHPLMANNITRGDLDQVIAFLSQDDPRLTNGPKVTEFEKAWSDWLGVKHSVYVSSGSAANFLTIQALKRKFPKGGKVIVPPLTWVSDIASVLHFGFEPLFVDITFETLSLDSNLVIDALDRHPEVIAVFVTHAQGFCGITTELINELRYREIVLIEDVCESHGASFGSTSKKLGTYGWASNFSFFYAHHMSTIEGGMICTDDDDLYQLLRMNRSHGMVRESTDSKLKFEYTKKHPDLNPDFIFNDASFNFRGNEIGAVIGLAQLKRLDSNIAARNENHITFLKDLDDRLYFKNFDLLGHSNYAFQLILKTEFTDKVSELMNLMSTNGVEFRRGSAGGGNQMRQPYMKNIEFDSFHKFPVVEYIHKFGFYLGNFPDLSHGRIKETTKLLNTLVDY